MRIFCGAIVLLCLAPGSVLAKEKIMTLSWGDVIWQHRGQGVAQIDTPEKIRESIKTWKSKGVDKVHFRVDDFRILLFHQFYLPPTSSAYHKEAAKTTKEAWQRNLVQVAVESLKKEGIVVDMYITILDEGLPPEMLGGDRHFFPWQSSFTRQNPQFLSVDRSLPGSPHKYHYGVLEYAYPEVREYMLKMITTFSDRFNFDGVFLSLRSHSPPPEHADQFGFNEPVVKEYERRYGRNILLQSFDLEKWRDLRGEYLTAFLRDVKTHVSRKGQKLAIGIPQGEYLGPPFGNMKLQWQQWVSEKIIDELVVGHITQERSRYPDRNQRAYGYIQNQEENLNLPPIEQAIAESYGPLCRKHGVKLYVDPERFYYEFDHPAFGAAKQRPEVRARLIQKLEAIPDLTGLTYDYSDILGLNRTE
jgi:hypothetical protein